MSFLPELGPHYVERAAAVGLRFEDVAEHFILGSGHGGQRRNKRSTAVQLVHHPSGIEVRCFHKRMQHQNRIDAWEHLLLQLEERHTKQQQAEAHEKHVEWVHTHKPSDLTQKHRLQEKKHRAKKKEVRQDPAVEQNDGVSGSL